MGEGDAATALRQTLKILDVGYIFRQLLVTVPFMKALESREKFLFLPGVKVEIFVGHPRRESDDLYEPCGHGG